MVSQRRYRLKQHYKFEQKDRKYVADLETGDILEVNAVEWEILSRYESQTWYQIVEGLKQEYKVSAIFDGIERLEHLGRQGSLLSPVIRSVGEAATDWEETERYPKVLVPFDFAQEKLALDHVANLKRYQLLTHLTKYAELETLTLSKEGPEADMDLGEISVRHIEVMDDNTFSPAWYAGADYTGILLLSQFFLSDMFFYQVPDVPIVHCIEGFHGLQGRMLETLLTLNAFQNEKDTLVVKSSWMKAWLGELGIPGENVCVIPDGINVVSEPFGDKALAKRHTAAIFDNPMFVKQPVIGLISGFEPNRGAAWISEFARSNRHLAIFVYDAMLARHAEHLPENVVAFSVDNEKSRSILPLFFQALDLVCFPAVPGTPLSVVSEAMAYGAACVVMTKYGMPAEVAGAGVVIESEWDNLGNFRVPMRQLSETINGLLAPCSARAAFEDTAKGVTQRLTWEKTAEEIARLFKAGPRRKKSLSRTTKSLFPSIFCRRYDPGTGTIDTCAYRHRTGTYEHLETALAEVLSEHHTSAEVDSVFKHFQWAGSAPTSDTIDAGNKFPSRGGQETNLANMEHWQKGGTPNEC
ncbi:glycosyltransferase family 4 protein [Candidatus Poribacteria bacterium]|nr:glycosyltransferase family 4 protein [Candidatus Poribacteria bacterium]